MAADRDNESRRQRGRLPLRFARWQDITLAVAVVAVFAGYFLLRDSRAAPGAVARVYVDEAEVAAIPLGEEDDYRMDLLEDYGKPVSLLVQGGGIRFVDVTCPDHICEKTGVISKEGQTAVCMPNRVTVVVGGGVP